MAKHPLIVQTYKLWRIFATGLSFVLFGLGSSVIAFLMVVLLYPLPISRHLKQHWTRSLIRSAMWIYIRIMRALFLLTFEFKDMDKLSAPGQLVIANHPSLLDAVFLMSVMPEPLCIVKQALWRNPFTFGAVSLAGYISNSSESLVEKAAEAINQGQSLIIFPEGTRTIDDQNRSLKRGAANIAIEAQCPLRPVYISCKPATLRKHEKWHQVPDSRPHFSFQALETIELSDCIDSAKPKTLQVRQLNKFIKTYYAELDAKLG